MTHRQAAWAVFMACALAAAGCSGGAGDGASAKPSKKPSSSASPAPPPIVVNGWVDVDLDYSAYARAILNHPKREVAVGLTECLADDGFDDIHEGTQVVIADAVGKTVALGALRGGVLEGEPGEPIITAKCRFPFTVSDVPGAEDFYSVQVGRRGDHKYSRADMLGNLALTLS